MKNLKKVIAFVLTFAMLASSSTAFAAGNRIPVSVDEIDGVRTVITVDETTEYTVIYDMVNNTMQYSERDIQTNTVTSSEAVEIEQQSLSWILATTVSKDTTSGFKYVVITGTKTEWELQRPRNDGTSGRYYFKCYANSSNSTELATFKTEVNTLSNNEATFRTLTTTSTLANLGAGFIAGFAIASAGILSAAAITAIVAAAGATGAAVAAGEAVGTQCNNCMLAIDAVYYATDNMHF